MRRNCSGFDSFFAPSRLFGDGGSMGQARVVGGRRCRGVGATRDDPLAARGHVYYALDRTRPKPKGRPSDCLPILPPCDRFIGAGLVGWLVRTGLGVDRRRQGWVVSMTHAAIDDETPLACCLIGARPQAHSHPQTDTLTTSAPINRSINSDRRGPWRTRSRARCRSRRPT